MKTSAYILTIVSLLFMSQQTFASNLVYGNPGKSPEKTVKAAMDKQISKHIFHPQSGKSTEEGAADVMLRLMPRGDVQVVTIKSDNPRIQKFIENQVKKMKVPTNEVVVGQLFKYQLVFKQQ